MKKYILLTSLSLLAFACSEDDDATFITSEDTLTISGGPFEFYKDGEPDYVSGITITEEPETVYDNATWVVTSEDGTILGLPATTEDLEWNDFDPAPDGTCYIWKLKYNDISDITLEETNASDLEGEFVLSNSIAVVRNGVEAATISGGPYTFTVGDSTSDYVTDIAVSDSGKGEFSTWVITDEDGLVLGLPATLEDVYANDFDGASAGVCLIWYLNYNGELSEITPMETNTADITGEFALSNSLTVNRNSSMLEAL